MTGMAITVVISFYLKRGPQSKAEVDKPLGMHNYYLVRLQELSK